MFASKVASLENKQVVVPESSEGETYEIEVKAVDSNEPI